MFVIYNLDEKLFWENNFGWGNIHSATIFDTDDVGNPGRIVTLPFGGFWVQKEIAGLLPVKE